MTVAAFIALASLAGAAPGAPPDAPASPALELRGLRSAQATATGTTLTFDLGLTNPTAAPLQLASVTFTVEVLGKRAIEASFPVGADVAPGASLSFPIVAELRWADLPAMAFKAALGKAPYRLVVAATVRTPLGEIVLPFTYDGELSVPKRPGFGLSGLRVASLNPLDAAVEVRVSVENENGFPLPPGLLRFRISIAGSDVTSAEVALPTVAPAAKVVVPIPVAVSLRQAGRGVFSALKGASTAVGLHAVASIGELSFPVDLEAQLPTNL